MSYVRIDYPIKIDHIEYDNKSYCAVWTLNEKWNWIPYSECGDDLLIDSVERIYGDENAADRYPPGEYVLPLRVRRIE